MRDVGIISGPFSKFGEYLSQVLFYRAPMPEERISEIELSVASHFAKMTDSNPTQAQQVRRTLQIISNAANTITTSPANTSTPAQIAEKLQLILENFTGIIPEGPFSYGLDSANELTPSSRFNLVCKKYRLSGTGTLFIALPEKMHANPTTLFVKFNSSVNGDQNLNTTKLSREGDFALFNQVLALWHKSEAKF